MVRDVTITGTRSLTREFESQLPGLFADYLQPFAVPRSGFYIGGAVGIDAAALDWLAEYTPVSLTVVVPCTVAHQPTTAQSSIHRWERQGRLADIVELGADQLGTDAYHARNRWMIDRSEMVIGFPHGTEQASGTWYAVNYAAQQNKPRLIVPV